MNTERHKGLQKYVVRESEEEMGRKDRQGKETRLAMR